MGTGAVHAKIGDEALIVVNDYAALKCRIKDNAEHRIIVDVLELLSPSYPNTVVNLGIMIIPKDEIYTMVVFNGFKPHNEKSASIDCGET